MKCRGKLGAVLGVTIALSLPVLSQNELAAVRSTPQSIEVRLKNVEAVAGVQFSLRSSSNIVLESVGRTGRTADASWMVASHRLNDSTINVVILSSGGGSLNAGEGSLIAVPFHAGPGAGIHRVDLSNVMAANPKAESLGVNVRPAEWSDAAPLAASTIELEQNFPNPFNPSTRLAYRLAGPMQVRLSVYDMAGREVERLVDGMEAAGEHQIVWNSTDDTGRAMASGVYFARLQAGEEVAIRKMTLMK